jgi:hypothetical protein
MRIDLCANSMEFYSNGIITSANVLCVMLPKKQIKTINSVFFLNSRMNCQFFCKLYWGLDQLYIHKVIKYYFLSTSYILGLGNLDYVLGRFSQLHIDNFQVKFRPRFEENWMLFRWFYKLIFFMCCKFLPKIGVVFCDALYFLEIQVKVNQNITLFTKAALNHVN